MSDCKQGIPNHMLRADVPPDGSSSTPNVSSTAIDVSTQATSSVVGTIDVSMQATSSVVGTTTSSQVQEGFAAQPNVGSTTMRTSASEGRLVTFRTMKVGEVVTETQASPEIAFIAAAINTSQVP